VDAYLHNDLSKNCLVPIKTHLPYPGSNQVLVRLGVIPKQASTKRSGELLFRIESKL